MSALPRTTDAAIVDAALELLERDGIESLTMKNVAGAVGVRAPSLYKRFASREVLLTEVRRRTLKKLVLVLEGQQLYQDPRQSLKNMAFAYRRFAKTSPHTYSLLYSPADLGEGEWAAAARPLLQEVAALVGSAHALPAARMLVAFVHGFVSMELAGAFHLGGSLEDSFRLATDRIVSAL